MKKSLKSFIERLNEQAEFNAKAEADNLMKQAMAWLQDEATDEFGEDADAVVAEVKKMLKDPSIIE